MSLTVCGQCGTRYAIGVDRCPHCSSTEVAPDGVGRVPVAVTVHCPADYCDAYGKQRRVVLRQVAMGIVEIPTLLCTACGSRAAVRWPGQLKEDNDMPKITVHGGPTNGPAVVGGSWGDEQRAAAPDENVVMVGEHGLERVVSDGNGGIVAKRNGIPMTPEEFAAGEPAGDPLRPVVDESGEPVVFSIEDDMLGGPSKPLPEAVEGDTTEHVSEPDYDTWTPKQLRAVLNERKLSTSGSREVLIARLRKNDQGDNQGDEQP